MIDDKCPECGTKLVADETRDTALCPCCGKKFPYSSIKKSARDAIESGRWQKEKLNKQASEKKNVAALKKNIVAAACFGGVTLAALIAFCIAGDRLSFTLAAIPLIVIFYVVFAAFILFSIVLAVKIKKNLYNGVLLYVTATVPLVLILAISVPVFVVSMHYYGYGMNKDGYIYSIEKDGVSIVEYRGDVTEEFTVPGVIDGKTVVSVGDRVFEGNTSITSLSLGEGIKTVGYRAFYNMANLENLSLPSTLEFANVQSFAGAAKLKQLVLPQAMKTLGNYAFADLSSVTSVTVPDSVTDIGKNVFSGCNSLTDFTVPYVGKYSDRGNYTHFGYFFGAPTYDMQQSYIPASLKNVTITKALSLGTNSFSGCNNLTSINVLSAQTISSAAFVGCTGVERFVFPQNIGYVGMDAFMFWTENQTVVLPAGVSDAAWDENWSRDCLAVIVRE